MQNRPENTPNLYSKIQKMQITGSRQTLCSLLFYVVVLLSLQLEGEETLKYFCVCRPPFARI